ncbi:hypothetical protein PNOK_0129300 [Pyrrhoderma noxium]|uniref:Uncharacterized protein n=1 Tax=Pyrrhoderma noxium TaxID=2282107 RepID=A0A286UXP4_9AGAM|nr:hypothetical protein PNOK_0129300 [Pyrrhoderma noxium]
MLRAIFQQNSDKFLVITATAHLNISRRFFLVGLLESNKYKIEIKRWLHKFLIRVSSPDINEQCMDRDIVNTEFFPGWFLNPIHAKQESRLRYQPMTPDLFSNGSRRYDH